MELEEDNVNEMSMETDKDVGPNENGQIAVVGCSCLLIYAC